MSLRKTFDSFLGPELVKNGEIFNTVDFLTGKKHVGLFFGGRWCGFTRKFLPSLNMFYYAHNVEKKFEVVYVSGDRTLADFLDFTKEMPWVSVPFHSDTREKLMEKYDVKSFPTMLIVNRKGKVLTRRARELIVREDPKAESYTDKGEKPAWNYFSFDHAKFWVGNAKQAADWYCGRFGFSHYAYKGLENGSREYAHHVVRQNNIFLEFISPYNPGNNAFGQEYIKHGDGVKDIVFRVDNVEALYKAAIEAGGKSISAPQEIKDAKGTVTVATIQTYGDTHHTFINRDKFTGVFLPGYAAVADNDPFTTITGPVGLDFIDHIVGNQADNQMVPIVEWYEKVLKFHRFWSVDDKMMHTEYSALRSIVVTDFDEKIKMPVNEPAAGKKKSQIQEFVDYYGGAGAQHIALNTKDILTAITHLRSRGCKFLTVPKTYYTNLREKLKHSPVQVKESLDTLEALDILVDYDDKGYLLQIFTQPVEDRPTLFFEIIQRNNHQGFGAGNFKALFEAIERAQEERGNL